jgi:CRP-like cAMP-binding protein
MINVLKPGDTFGEVSLINPKMLTTARVVAKCDTTLLVANQDTFYRTLNVPEHMKYSEKLNYFRNNILF